MKGRIHRCCFYGSLDSIFNRLLYFTQDMLFISFIILLLDLTRWQALNVKLLQSNTTNINYIKVDEQLKVDCEKRTVWY